MCHHHKRKWNPLTSFLMKRKAKNFFFLSKYQLPQLIFSLSHTYIFFFNPYSFFFFFLYWIYRTKVWIFRKMLWITPLITKLLVVTIHHDCPCIKVRLILKFIWQLRSQVLLTCYLLLCKWRLTVEKLDATGPLNLNGIESRTHIAQTALKK